MMSPAGRCSLLHLREQECHDSREDDVPCTLLFDVEIRPERSYDLSFIPVETLAQVCRPSGTPYPVCAVAERDTQEHEPYMVWIRGATVKEVSSDRVYVWIWPQCLHGKKVLIYARVVCVFE